MKKLLLLLSFFLFSLMLSAQTFNYQAAIRDGSNDLVTNQAIGLQISINQGSATGTSVYQETHLTPSNDYGIISIEIGAGTIVSGNFNSIDWSTANYWLEISADITGGTSYSLLGASKLQAVPFAMYAASGTAGPQGPQGIQGPQGLQGVQGPAGPTGATGPQGIQGPAGAQGPTGAQGPVGPEGPQGPQGPAGANGIDGADGIDGTNGVDGADGIDGDSA
ncbi:hypothetical protein ACFQ1M_15445, partial [Sungkyunkwania multivorans]